MYGRSPTRPSATSSLVVSVFVVAVLFLAYLHEPFLLSRPREYTFAPFATQHKGKDKFPFPDFNKYVHTHTLPPEAFGIGAHDERVLVIGDTHGMNRSLHNLLTAVEYNPRKDTIFMSGDILAKSTETGSLAILDFIVRQKQGLCAKATDDASRLQRFSPSASKRKTPPCKPIYAVRGNHDQMVIQWRAWRDWFEQLQIPFSARLHPPRRLSLPSSLSALASSLPLVVASASYDAGPAVGTGSEFLALIEAEWLRDRKKDPNGAGSDVEEWIDVARKRAQGTWRAEWWKRIPRPGKGRAKKEWIMFGDHYNIARDMNMEQAQYLYSLPLVIHIPSEHFFLAHAGLLPYDPRKSFDDKRQPLAHAPSADEEDDEEGDDYDYPTVDVGSSRWPFPPTGLDEGVDELRVLQEHSLLEDIPHNRDPWVILNIRSILKDGTISRGGSKGTPWAKVWNGQMKRCAGFAGADVNAKASPVDPFASAGDRDKDEDKEKELPCYPSTVVYGHAAARDLDVRRWTLGLDTGCVYGRRLTALVLTHGRGKDASATTQISPSDDEDDEDDDEGEVSSDEEEGEVDDPETVLGGAFLGVNSRFARVEGGSAISRRAKRPKTWTREIKFGDKHSDLGARLVSVKCPKVGDLA